MRAAMMAWLSKEQRMCTTKGISMEYSPRDAQPPLIYLNNAATTWPKPAAVLEEVAACLRQPLHEPGRTTGNGSVDYPSAAREALADFFHAGPPEHFVFTQNATDSLNLLVHGFVKKTGMPFHAITTELEHNSVLRPLTALEQDGAVRLSVVPFTGTRVNLAAIKKAICEDTRLVVMTHGSNVLGSVQDIRPIAEYLQANDIFFIVDGAQTAGHIPVDLSDIPVGAFVFTGHKALFGIPGIGGFFISEPDAVAITRQGGTGTDSRTLTHPSEMPLRFEAGTHNYPGIASLCAGIRFITSTGQEAIGEKNTDLTRCFIRDLKDIQGITIYNKNPDLPVVSFNITGIDNHEVGFILARAYNVITRTGLHCAPLVHERIDGGKGCVRAGLSYFNTRDECRAAAEAVREVAESADSHVRSDESLC
ncbi:MAG TPA: aminotransferase class V-fold PLP-dependent enzyme [Methanoregula sp.]|nr:aminotransferase class V-fold PLP-dependent enzyme [Methanoregula sp.]